MLAEVLVEWLLLALIVASAYALLAAYARRRRPDWSEPLARRRMAILSMLVLAVVTAKVSEDVVAGESGPIDRALLWLVREHVPRSLDGFFQVLTNTGASIFVWPLAAAVVLAMLRRGHRAEALLVLLSTGLATIVVYVVKLGVGRVRPHLWTTDWYWGSSFPSGHTLVVTAFATATAICAGRFWPKYRWTALALAFAWSSLVGLSRLVLGVHWPTDVLAAACIGAFLPMAIELAQAGIKKRRRPVARTP